MNILVFFQGNAISESTPGQSALSLFMFALMAFIIIGLGIWVGIKAFKSNDKDD